MTSHAHKIAKNFVFNLNLSLGPICRHLRFVVVFTYSHQKGAFTRSVVLAERRHYSAQQSVFSIYASPIRTVYTITSSPPDVAEMPNQQAVKRKRGCPKRPSINDVIEGQEMRVREDTQKVTNSDNEGGGKKTGVEGRKNLNFLLMTLFIRLALPVD